MPRDIGVVGPGDEVTLFNVIPVNVGEAIGGFYDADMAAPIFSNPDPKVDQQRVICPWLHFTDWFPGGLLLQETPLHCSMLFRYLHQL